ncbi:hypothetical protein EZV62_019097 [Acer yangbiense]|uniref:UTP23 sensor motif region domain-containing protein n=1 Tax=Acer yangbiense TaxID=1000413 RepID=A0A5C7HAB2_9ROSI|nr:hypothetical protein EZV62_019097 [Acer yangbiense]
MDQFYLLLFSSFFQTSRPHFSHSCPSRRRSSILHADAALPSYMLFVLQRTCSFLIPSAEVLKDSWADGLLLAGSINYQFPQVSSNLSLAHAYVYYRLAVSTFDLSCPRCVIDELKGLGESHSKALQGAHKLTIARCEHERKKSADACIMDVIGEKNPEHFFVATQDVDLRKKLQEVPGVPLIFGLRNALFLEQPSQFQRQFVKASEEGRSCMTESEYKMMKKRAKGILETEEIRDSSNEDEDVGDQNLELHTVKKSNNARKHIGVKDKPQFKRKRAKGPNPLSCKKKKSHENPSLLFGKVSKDGNNSVQDMKVVMQGQKPC